MAVCSTSTGDDGEIGTRWAGFLGAITKTEAESVIFAEAEGIASSTTKGSSQSLHVIPADLLQKRSVTDSWHRFVSRGTYTALWQGGDVLGKANADQCRGDDEGLHD